MKRIILILLAILPFYACENNQQASNEQSEKQVLGGDKDEHNCKGSAGQTWSILKNDCVQIFNEGLRLNPVEHKDGATFSAFVLLNNDSTKAELFLPNDAPSIVLDKNSESLFSKDNYTFNAKDQTLMIDNTVKYVVEVKK